MISLLLFLLLTVMQGITGFGLQAMVGVRMKSGLLIPLSFMLGMAVQSLIPFLLQLFYIPLSPAAVWTGLGLAMLVFNLRWRKSIRLAYITVKYNQFRIYIYEFLFILLIGALVAIAAWRSFYQPPTPRDLTSGAEVIAEYAAREHTMVNSVFTVNLETTNNQFKPPYLASLQLIYKYAGFPFGQVWLTTLVISFLIFLYHLLITTLHRSLAGFLLLAFVMVPEMYAYSFMALFDYPNAVYFLISTVFLLRYFGYRQKRYLLMSALTMAVATYIRTETMILAFMLSPMLMAYDWRKRRGWLVSLRDPVLYLFPTVCAYVLTVTIYLHHYLPARYDVAGLINHNLLNVEPLWNRFWDMCSILIFSEQGLNMYGYLFFIFLVIALFDFAYERGIDQQRKNWLYAVLVVFLGLPVMGFLLPLMDLEHTTKRGLFKLFPLILIYLAESPFLKDCSVGIVEWEMKKGRSGPVPSAAENTESLPGARPDHT